MTNENENQSAIIEAITDFKQANPNAVTLQEQVFTGYLLNCATGAIDLKEDIVLFNQTLVDLFRTIN